MSPYRGRAAVALAVLCAAAVGVFAPTGWGATPSAIPGEEGEGTQATAPPPFEPGVTAVLDLEVEAEVRGDAILLGEVAAVRTPSPPLTEWLESLPVGSSPPAGDERRLSGGMILPTLRRLAPGVEFRLDEASSRQWVHVIRASQRLMGEQISEAIDKAVAKAFPRRVNGGFQFTFSNLPQTLRVPVGEVAFDVRHLDRLDRSRPGPASLTVNVLVDGEPARTLWLRAWVEPNGTRPSRKAGGAGGAGPTAGVAGEPQGQPVIQRGDTVELVAIVGDMRVSTRGVARRDGRIGEEIPVRNPESGKVVYGRVVDGGVVRVQAAP